MSVETTTNMNNLVAAPSYWRYFWAFYFHALIMMARRQRAILAGALALLPVIIPLALAYLSDAQFADNGSQVFVRMTESLYLKAIVPLLGLFFACMLIGEEAEAQTLPYVLARPAPRSAVILGKFLAFVVVAMAVLAPALCLVYAACTLLGRLSFSAEGLKLLAHYLGVMTAAVAGYGAFCMFLGAITKRPIILGILLLFGWQRLASFVPGLIDFFTIEKYLNALLPMLPTQREAPRVQAVLFEFQKQEFLVDASKALVTLAVITAVFIFLTQLVLRWREYTSARTVGN